MNNIPKLCYGLLFFLVCSSIAAAEGIHHYVFFNRDRERISEPTFLETSAFEGAQLKYTWRELEPEKDSYNFGIIQSDLDFLTSKGKKLFIQLQEVSFDMSIVNVPLYLTKDRVYNGGVDKQYHYEGDEEENAVPEGWVARRWDPVVQKRFHKLLFALGKEFDGKIEGINLPETAVGFGESGLLFPKGFSFDVYRDAIIENMKALKKAFPKSVAMQYANFMPGEWLPWKDLSYLRSVYQSAQELKVGVGGPDLRPYRKGQMNHSYKFIRESDGIIPTGIAVQWGNYEHINPKTDKQVTIPGLLGFGKEYLKIDYIFWCIQEPYYSERLIPFLDTISQTVYRFEDKRISMENGSLMVTLDPSTLEMTIGNKDRPDELLSVSRPVFNSKDFSVDEDGLSILYPDDGLKVTFGLEDGVLGISIYSERPQTFQWPSIPMVRENTTLIWPHFEGRYIPLDDDPWTDHLESSEWNTLESLYMPFWGVESEDNPITYIVENPFHNEITFHGDDATMRLDFEHSFPDNNDLSMPVSFRIHLDHHHTPITPAKHFRDYLIKQNSFVSLKQKMEIAPRISRLIGAPHANIHDGAAITISDIHEDGWIPLMRTLVEQSRSQDPTLGKRIKHIMLGKKEGKENWAAFVRMSSQQWPYAYLKRVVALELSKALLSPQLFTEEIWPAETLPDDLQKVIKKEKPSRYELMKLNGHLLYSSFPKHLNDPATWGNGISTRMIDALSHSGMDRFLLCLSGWGEIDIRPHIASYAEEKGYLIGTYDSYHCIHDPARADDSWLTPLFDQKLYEEGGIIKRNGEPYRGYMQIGYKLSPIAARPYVEQRVTENFSNVPYSYYFIDCDAFGEFYDDYRPGRKVSQSEDANARIDRIRWIFETFKVPVGSEGASYLFAGVLSVAEGVMLPVFWGDPDMNNPSSRYFVGRADESERLLPRVPLKEKYVHLHADPRYLLPLYEAVFHDSVITRAHASTSSLQFTNIAQTIALAEILYQVAPMYHLNLSSFEKDKSQIKRHSQVFGRTHRYSYRYALEDFEFLTNERDVQRTRFGNLELIANFTKNDFDHHGKRIPGRSVLATFKDTGESFIYRPPDMSGDSTDKRSVSELSLALSSSEWREREKAAIAIAKIGVEAKTAIPALIERLDDEEWQVRRAAADTLANLEPEADSVVPVLTVMLKDEEWQVRKSAAYALAAIGTDLESAIPSLIEALTDEEWQVRMPAILAIGAIGSDAREAVPALKEALNDPELQVRSAAINALRNIGE